MVELSTNGQYFESVPQSMKYTKQIADIFDLAVVASSYTNGFSIPKTPVNTAIMQGLGIVGDTSQIPYSKVPSSLRNYGFTIFQNGWLSVKDTGDDYNVSCIDGMIDFFKAIENKTMGTDLDLSNFNHIKDLPSVIASFSNIYYKYIVADYNGKNLGTFEDTEGINIDYLVPCFNIRKLFDLVMSTFGYGFSDTNITEINDLYITYPKNPAESTIDTLSASMHYDGFTSPVVALGGDFWTSPRLTKTWSSSVINEGSLVSNWQYVVGEASGYRINVTTEMYALYRNYYNYNKVKYMPMQVSVTVNGTPVISFESDPYDPVSGETILYLNVGDVVEFEFKATPYELPNGRRGLRYQLREIHHNGTDLTIYKTNQGNVNLSDAFKDYSIKDFIKEIFIRTATTPVIDTLNNQMSFVSLDERLDFSRSVNWTSRFVKRKKESYIQGYAQKNIFAHKYNDEDDISQNGYLYVNNKNIEAEKTIWNSRIYAPELINYTFTDNVTTNKFTIWERQVKEATDGELSIDYKGLNGRFYIMKLLQSPVGEYNFVSEAVGGLEMVTQYPYADSSGTTYDKIIPDKYGAYSGVLDNFRQHDIEVALTVNDVLGLDLTKPYYFKQEGMHYMLNKIVFSEGDTLVGEFIRINKFMT